MPTASARYTNGENTRKKRESSTIVNPVMQPQNTIASTTASARARNRRSRLVAPIPILTMNQTSRPTSPIAGHHRSSQVAVSGWPGSSMLYFRNNVDLGGLDARGLVISLFFGLVFAGGHLNQEVRDYEADLLNGIRTNAVAFGRRRAFLASLATLTAAYAILTISAACGILPKLLVASALVWMLHVAWSIQALRRGLGFETALWMQRRYRLLFALIGLVVLVTSSPLGLDARTG